MKSTLPPRDLALIGVVVVAWGTNFVAMTLALGAFPPFLLVALRTLVLLPLLAIVPRPKAPWWAILAIGAFIHAGQFGFLFAALVADVSPGLASLILQVQAPLTIVLSVAVFGERVRPAQAIGIAVAALGLFIVGASGGGNVTPVGLALVLIGAASWACGNLVLKTLSGAPMLPIFLWAGLVPPVPMLMLSAALETPDPLTAVLGAGPLAWAALAYVAVISIVLGFSLWGALIARHTAAAVTPFALLIPVVGMASAALVLGDLPSPGEAAGALVVFAGLALAVLAPRRA
ncbi:MAG: EamA family transporter [Pseudomonadota bacterium]